LTKYAKCRRPLSAAQNFNFVRQKGKGGDWLRIVVAKVDGERATLSPKRENLEIQRAQNIFPPLLENAAGRENGERKMQSFLSSPLPYWKMTARAIGKVFFLLATTPLRSLIKYRRGRGKGEGDKSKKSPFSGRQKCVLAHALVGWLVGCTQSLRTKRVLWRKGVRGY